MKPTSPTLADTWSQEPPSQYLLWIDGAGGFLVCLSPRVTLGQGASEAGPDVPLLANVARHHASIHRDGEGYFLEAHRPVSLNGKAVDKAYLRSGDRLTLGATCQLQFTRPVPISNSARLELVSGQRLVHPVHAVLLMAETLVLGPTAQAHVVVEDLEQPIILFRPREGLAIRYAGQQLMINGQAQPGRGTLRLGARVSTDVVSLALEGVPQPR